MKKRSTHACNYMPTVDVRYEKYFFCENVRKVL